MGVVHHAAYLPYLEETRVAFLREMRHPYAKMRSEGLDAPVLEIAVRYRQPLQFDEEVDVHLWGGAVTRTTFQLAYLLTVDGEVRATAVSVHGCVDADGKASRLPAWIAELFIE
jgi:acyl-CoA thioester hydrolase